MEYTDEDWAWACGQIGRLSIFKRTGFPESIADKETIVKSFLKILQDQPGNSFEIDKGKEGGIVEVVVPPVSARESGERLIEHIIENAEYFPLPVKMRQMYSELFLETHG